MNTTYLALIKYLDDRQTKYEVITHEPVYTSEEAANIRGLGLKTGAKSLLLKVNSDFNMFVLPGDQKLDSKKLKQVTRSKKVRFATPNEVEAITGTQIGAVYPFGEVAFVKMFVDRKLAENEIIAFNPGVHHKSIIMSFNEYKRVTNCTLVDITIDQA